MIENLAQVHDNRLVNLLPQVSAENLDERDLQGGNLPVHENSCEIQLHLETYVHVRPVDRGRPPQSKAPIGNLVQPRPLRIRQLLILHRLLETGCLLPKETLPSGEVCSLEECVLQDTFHPAQRLNHVGTIVVQVPEFSIVTLVRPPEGILLQDLIGLKLCPHSPSLVIREGVTIFLEEGVDPRDSSVPRVLQVFKGQATVLCIRVLTLKSILGPDALRVNKLSLPRLNVSEKEE